MFRTKATIVSCVVSSEACCFLRRVPNCLPCAGSEAAIKFVEDSDFTQCVRIVRLESLLWLHSRELESDVDIVLLTIPRMFFFPDFHEVGEY